MNIEKLLLRSFSCYMFHFHFMLQNVGIATVIFMLHVSFSFFMLQNVGIFGYSRKKLTDEGLRSIIEANLTCRVDHQYVIWQLFI